MTARWLIQFSLPYGLILFLWIVSLMGCALEALTLEHSASREQTVSDSAFLTMSWMWFAWMLMSVPRELRFAGIARFSRFVWTLGLLALLIHITIALGIAHRWSHAAAVDHVRQVGGFGSGIVVNYLFAAIWLADVIWWWVNPIGHSNRSRWVDWALHAFLMFVVLNATVVFGPAERRSIYCAGLIVTFLWLLSVRTILGTRLKPPDEMLEPGRRPGSVERSRPAETHSPT